MSESLVKPPKKKTEIDDSRSAVHRRKTSLNIRTTNLFKGHATFRKPSSEHHSRSDTVGPHSRYPVTTQLSVSDDTLDNTTSDPKQNQKPSATTLDIERGNAIRRVYLSNHNRSGQITVLWTVDCLRQGVIASISNRKRPTYENLLYRLVGYNITNRGNRSRTQRIRPSKSSIVI